MIATIASAVLTMVPITAIRIETLDHLALVAAWWNSHAARCDLFAIPTRGTSIEHTKRIAKMFTGLPSSTEKSFIFDTRGTITKTMRTNIPAQWAKLALVQWVVAAVTCGVLFFFRPSGDGLYMLPIALAAVVTAVASIIATYRICRASN